jgi:preprotein translocase subunit YajC
MDVIQVLWGINTTLVLIILYFIKEQREDMKELKKEIEKRTLIVTCDKLHAALSKDLHVHASTGTAGEVVKK